MKTAIVYYSGHRGNTKKLLDAIAKQGDVTLFEAANSQDVDLAAYDLIGFASGTYFGRFHRSVVKCAEKNLPRGKKVFFIYTYGASKPNIKKLEQIAKSRDAQMMGEYGCRGFDTFGPFKLFGGIAKGHPTAEEIAGAAKFFQDLAAKSAKGR
ncbi:MAG TPA: flavodoxin [Firmicutes bacterium]|jgi:flavodoxin|nr:flavodoxin [Bacillota bacterium]